MKPIEIIVAKNERIIAELNLNDKQSIVDMLGLVQIGWCSTRRAADEIMRFHQTAVELLEEQVENMRD